MFEHIAQPFIFQPQLLMVEQLNQQLLLFLLQTFYLLAQHPQALLLSAVSLL